MAEEGFFHRHRWQFLTLGVLALLLVWGAVRWWRGPVVWVAEVAQRDFVQTVVASGRVVAPHRVDVGSQITGTVVAVPVREGQSVKAGDTLIELQSDEFRAAMQQADLAVEQGQIRIRQLREVQQPLAAQALRQAQVSYQNSEAQWRRSQELARKGFIGEAALDEARKAHDIADAQLQSAQTQWHALQRGGADDLLAQAVVSQARAAANVARARAAYTVIRAVADGTLIAHDVEVGSVVQPGKVLMGLSPSGMTQLVVQIDEKNLRLLALGQQALASADAYPQQRFEAALVYINPGVNPQTGALEVKLDVPLPPAYLKQDMTVSVDIEVARRPHAVVVSSEVVHDADSQAPWVLVAQGGRALRRPIRLGLRHAGYSEVLEGLALDDRVIPSASGLAPGDRLRAVVQASPP